MYSLCPASILGKFIFAFCILNNYLPQNYFHAPTCSLQCDVIDDAAEDVPGHVDNDREVELVYSVSQDWCVTQCSAVPCYNSVTLVYDRMMLPSDLVSSCSDVMVHLVSCAMLPHLIWSGVIITSLHYCTLQLKCKYQVRNISIKVCYSRSVLLLNIFMLSLLWIMEEKEYLIEDPFKEDVIKNDDNEATTDVGTLIKDEVPAVLQEDLIGFCDSVDSWGVAMYELFTATLSIV